jgi:hypothetical protein
MKRTTLPVHAVQPDGRVAFAAAFLGCIDNTVYLITAAHVPTGAQPTSDWPVWPEGLHLHLDSGIHSVELFNSGGLRAPRFGYERNGSGGLQDVLWLSVDDMGSGLAIELVEQVRTFSIPSTMAVTIGDPLEVHGFPDVAVNWPPPVQVARGTAIPTRRPPLMEAAISAPDGYSGGPVLDSGNHELIGMHIGHHPTMNDPGQVVPAAIIRGMLTTMPLS